MATSPSAESDPQTPQRQASSGILSAFKNLTGGKSRQSSPTAAPVWPFQDVRVSSPLELTSPQLLSRPLDGVYNMATSEGRRSNGHALDVETIGGPPELRSLVPQLSVQQPIAVRIQAMEEVTALLEQHEVNSVGSIWLAVKDMISDNDELGAVDAAYKLLLACAKQRSLTNSERKHLLDAVIGHNKPKMSVYRFKVLAEISNQGRNLDCIELQFIPLVVELLQHAYDCARKRLKNSKSPTSLTEAALLEDVFQYILNVTRFNSKFLKEEDLQLLGNEILAICRKTSSVADLSKSIEVLDGIVTYADLPQTSLSSFVEVLCEIYSQVPALKEQSWTSVSKLANSHYGLAVIQALLAILHGNPTRQEPNRNSVRGAILIFREILASQTDSGLANFDTEALLRALRETITLNQAKPRADALGLVKDLLSVEGVVDSIFGDAEWDHITDILVRTSEQETRSPLQDSDADVTPQDLQQTGKESVHASVISAKLQGIADSLIMRASDMEFDRRRMVFSLLMRLAHVLNDVTAAAIVSHHQDERLLLPSDEKWLSNCHKLFETLFKDAGRSSSTRLLTLNAIYEGYNTSEALGIPDGNALITMMIGRVGQEWDPAVLQLLTDILTSVATWTNDPAMFDSILNALSTALLEPTKTSLAASATSPVRGNIPSRDCAAREQPLESAAVIISKAIVRLFLRAIQTSSVKSEKLYSLLLAIARSHAPPPESRIVAMKVLARIRSDVNYAIYIINSTECESLAATVCRTAESVARNEAVPESPVSRPVRSEDMSSRRSHQAPPGSPGQLGRQPSTSTRPYSSLGRMSRPTPPLWMYPGPKGLPENPPKAASHLVFSHLDPDTIDISQTTFSKCTLDTSAWLDLALTILARENLEWETYSYLVVHLGAQLTNHSLFIDAIPQIKRLRTLICSQLQGKSFHEPPSSTNLKKADVAICLYHILTMLVSYHAHFTRQEEDELVRIFVFGIGTWERASETCIHALSISCHELPSSISKSLETVLQKMSQIVTQTQASVHVLEFLCGLARLPELFRNFREDEFRTVFGICFRYLQYVRDQEGKYPTSRPGRVTFPGNRNSRELNIRSENAKRQESLAEVLPQYVYALAYHVMVFWFMSLKLQDRPHQMAWIIKNLVSSDEAGSSVVEEQSQVVIDMMHSMSYSEHDETAMDPHFAKESDGPTTSKSWLVGMSILTVETAGRTGLSQITRRRPSGTRFSIFRPLIAPPRHHQTHWSRAQTESYNSPTYVGILPDDVVQEFYAPQTLTSSTASAESPVLLPDDEMTRRSLSSFDRISALDGHKIGVIYVGEDQLSESEILANVMGSADYTAFLGSIGTLTELKGATFNTQGLDREFDSDGKFTFCWRDRVSEIVFHVTTMMPTDLEHDPQCAGKKKHIGNDFVNIIFNNSGHAFDFNTFPSDFNYVNIVVTPEARSSFVETRLHAARLQQNQDNETEKDLFYKVTVMTKAGLPKISPASETKILSGTALPAFIRLQVLNASVFSMVWAQRDGGEHVSSWRNRLREIAKLRERHSTASSPPVAAVASPPQVPVHQTASSVSQPSTRESSLLRRASAIFGDSGATRNSAVTLATDIDRSSSAGSRD